MRCGECIHPRGRSRRPTLVSTLHSRHGLARLDAQKSMPARQPLEMPGRYRFHSTRPAPWKRVGVASSVDRQSKGGVNFRHTKRRCFSVWLSTGTLTGFASLKRVDPVHARYRRRTGRRQRYQRRRAGCGREPCRKRWQASVCRNCPLPLPRLEPRWKFPDLPCPASLSIGEDSKEGADAGIASERGDLNPPDSWRNHALKTTFRPISNGG